MRNAKSLDGSKRFKNEDNGVPSPNAYNLPTAIDKEHGSTIRSRKFRSDESDVPAPNMYNVKTVNAGISKSAKILDKFAPHRLEAKPGVG